jgi:hypothetical protein
MQASWTNPRKLEALVLPADEEPPLPLQPGKEAFDEPAPFVSAEVASILSLEFPSGAMRRDHVDAVLLEILIEAIAVIGPVSDEMFRLGLQHVEVETELDQGDFMMIGGMRTDRERKSMAIHNRENLHALAAFREPDGLAATLGRCKRGINETLPFVEHSFVAQRVRQLGQHLAQDLLLTPLLESTMDGFVIRIALRQEVPLGPGIQNPEDGVQDRSGRHRFASRTVIGNVLFGEMGTNPLPLVITQTEHARTYTARNSGRQLF